MVAARSGGAVRRSDCRMGAGPRLGPRRTDPDPVGGSHGGWPGRHRAGLPRRGRGRGASRRRRPVVHRDVVDDRRLVDRRRGSHRGHGCCPPPGAGRRGEDRPDHFSDYRRHDAYRQSRRRITRPSSGRAELGAASRSAMGGSREPGTIARSGLDAVGATSRARHCGRFRPRSDGPGAVEPVGAPTPEASSGHRRRPAG